MLGDEVFVGDDAVLSNDVKVYPFKTIEDGAIVNSSIIWESRGARSLFGRMGVTGLANVDITPELAAKVAMAYGTSLRKGTTVVTSRDSSRSARMLKRAMMAGLNSAGVNVFDLEVASLPVTRFLVRSPRVVGGLSVRLRLDDPESVVVRFFDTHGRRHLRGRQAQDRAPVPAGGLPAGAARGDRRHRLPAPGPGGLHRRPREHRRHPRHRGPQVQAGGRLRLRRHLLRDAERAGQAGRRRAVGQPVRLDRRHR